MVSNAFKPPNLKEAIENYVCQQIADGHWTIGDRIPSIEELSVQLEVSHSTTREAIQSLCSAGLLQSRHGVGTFIKMFPHWLKSRPEMWRAMMEEEALLEIYEARELLEVRMAGLAAERATPDEIETMSRCLKDFGDALNRGDYEFSDLCLHQAIWKAAHNSVLLNMMQAVRSQLEEVIKLTAERTRTVVQLFPLHANVVDAIAAGDPIAARNRMQAHFDSIKNDLFLAIKEVSNTLEG